MSLVISTLFDAVLSKVLPRFGVPKEVTDTAKQVRDDSYDSLVKNTRVEPFCILDSTLVDLPYTETLLHVSLNILTGYYLQAVSLLNHGNGIPPIKMLRRLSPEGSLKMFSEEKMQLGIANRRANSLTTEDRTSRGGGRPYNKSKQSGSADKSQMMESSKDSPTRSPEVDKEIIPNTEENTGVGKVNIMEVKKSNLLVGKTLTIDFNTGDGKAIPITVGIRYDITETPPPLLIRHIAQGSPDSDFSTRLRKLRAGKIKFWSEFVFATDLLDDQRKLMLMDKNNLLSNIIKRRGAAQIGAATGGGRNYGVSSNCMIVSTTTMRQAEAVMKGDLSNSRVVESIFSTMSLLVLIVVDKEYERFTFYFRNKPIPTTVSAKVLKSGMGGDKEDSLEALAKALAGNKQVSF